MSKTVVIPKDRGSRVFVTVNGRDYIYEAGDTVVVPDEVAALFDANAYFELEQLPRRGVSPLRTDRYTDGAGGVPVHSDSEGNLFADPIAALGGIYVEGHTLVIPCEENEE